MDTTNENKYTNSCKAEIKMERKTIGESYTMDEIKAAIKDENGDLSAPVTPIRLLALAAIGNTWIGSTVELKVRSILNDNDKYVDQYNSYFVNVLDEMPIDFTPDAILVGIQYQGYGLTDDRYEEEIPTMLDSDDLYFWLAVLLSDPIESSDMGSHDEAYKALALTALGITALSDKSYDAKTVVTSADIATAIDLYSDYYQTPTE